VTEVPSESSAEQLLNIVFVVIGRQMSFALARNSSLCHSWKHFIVETQHGVILYRLVAKTSAETEMLANN